MKNSYYPNRDIVKLLLALIIVSLNTIMVFAGNYTVTGEYQGKNLYVQNPLSENKVNFCTQKVYLNDELVLENPKTSAYEINFDHLEVGTPIVIKIVHRDGCEPKIINPQVIHIKSKFQYLSTNANDNEISWMTRGEYEGGVFTLERYTNKDWHKDATVYGKGDFDSNQYSVSPNYHAGENKLRLKYETENGKIFYSRVFSFFSNQEPVSFYPTRVTDKIMLSRKTKYEIHSASGNLVTKGSGQEINCSDLQSGLYYLHIDNRKEKFFKK